jgi:SAM-dependent methyltransferase
VPKLYSELAAWWPLVSPVQEYADEARFFWRVLSDAGLPDSPSLLELGCGGGSNAFYLKNHFAQVTLSDLSPEMVAISRALNPECEHLEGDMRTLRLGRTFDVVFIHDAIEYMTSIDDLRRAMETAYVHCKPEGVALLVPDHVRETFEPSTDHAGGDGEHRSLRYTDWSYDPDPTDTTYITEYVYLLHEGDGPTRVEYDRHELGLFPRAEWLRLLQQVGFQTEIVPDQYKRDLFVARRTERGGL